MLVIPTIDGFALLAQLVEFSLFLARCAFGDFAIVLCMNNEHSVAQFGVASLQMGRDLIAVPCVVRHHEQDGLFFHLGQLVVGFFPFEITLVPAFISPASTSMSSCRYETPK